MEQASISSVVGIAAEDDDDNESHIRSRSLESEEEDSCDDDGGDEDDDDDGGGGADDNDGAVVRSVLQEDGELRSRAIIPRNDVAFVSLSIIGDGVVAALNKHIVKHSTICNMVPVL